ncbi:MAG: TRAP transporter small permease [Rhodobacter sp.]|nr:TRAP transporter small permease [Paracoccaceae bacterium]MCC0076287.1 TRAP transporter small permease [Rhodobacter sp.]
MLTVQRLRRALEGAAAGLGMTVLFAMMVLTFVDVLARYLFSAPIFGAVEIVQFLLATMIFAGFVLVNSRNAHIVVELFSAPLAHRWPKLMAGFSGIVSIAAMGLVAWALFRAALHAASRGSTSVVLQVPLAWVVGVMAGLSLLGFALLALALAIGGSGSASHGVEE